MAYWGLTTEIEEKYTELSQLVDRLGIPEKRKNLFKFPNTDWIIKTLNKRKPSEDVNRCLELLLENRDTCPGFLHTKKLDVLEEKEAVLVDKYKNLGIDVIADSNYRSNDLKAYINSVYFDLPAEVWVDMLNADGEILPACCGNISRIRDILFSVVRNDSIIRASDLCEAYTLLMGHECFDCENDPDDPLFKIKSLWEAIKDDASIKSLPGYAQDPNDVNTAFNVVARSCGYFDSKNFFSNHPNQSKFKEHISEIYTFNKMLPAIHKLYEHVQSLNLEPMDGYAVCLGNKIMTNGLGFLIEHDLATATQWANQLNEIEKESRTQNRIENARDKIAGHERDDRMKELRTRHNVYSIRKVTVSLEHGIQYEDGTVAEVALPGEQNADN